MTALRNGGFWAMALILIALGRANGADHNNIDAHRPLSFDDARTIAFREQSLEFGLGLVWPRDAPIGAEAGVEYLYGFALNSQVSLGLEPSVGGRAGEDSTAFDVGDVSVGLLHNFNREFNGTPAFSLRGDLSLPAGRGANGIGYRLRGILSRQAGQYGRLHVNLDLAGNADAPAGERSFRPGLIVGYTRPVGYPTHFSTTGLAEVGVDTGVKSGTGPVIRAGVGVRRQVGVRSVMDVGLRSDIAGFDEASRERLRLVAGYSYGF